MVALLNINKNPKLTKYLVENKLIHLKLVDVGARWGFADYWQVYGDCIEYIGFEPDKKQANTNILSYALDEKEGVRDFYIIRYLASSGFYPPNKDFAERLQNRFFLDIVDQVKLKTVTLDSLNLRPDFIKIDTEGSELDILRGGLKSLESTIGISVEVGFQELFKGQSLFEDVNKFLREQGFALYDLNLSRLDRLVSSNGMSRGKTGQVMQGQGLYFRDLYLQREEINIETILKLASLFELFNLADCAFELLNTPRTSEYINLIMDEVANNHIGEMVKIE